METSFSLRGERVGKIQLLEGGGRLLTDLHCFGTLYVKMTVVMETKWTAQTGNTLPWRCSIHFRASEIGITIVHPSATWTDGPSLWV